jgi:hypothetical protein
MIIDPGLWSFVSTVTVRARARLFNQKYTNTALE